MAFWKADRFEDDAFVAVGDGEALPAGAVIVSLARFLAERDALLSRTAPLGVAVPPAGKLDDIAVDLPKLAVVSLAFPKFSDGRSFSTARLLRERHGFTGEIRATGDVLFDRIDHMLRCGFDAFVIVNQPTIEALTAGKRPGGPLAYQPTGQDDTEADDLKPWRRRVR
jgi:uncharacterized protein (DUF934 family)